MEPREFFDWVAGHSEVEWLGVSDGETPADDEVLIHYHKFDTKFAISASAIRNNTLEELSMVIYGTRSPQIMGHFSRIVGYYSNLKNWNESKIAELHDRQKGDYTIHGTDQGDGNVEREATSSASKAFAQARQPAGV